MRRRNWGIGEEMLIEYHSPMIAICKSLLQDQEKKMMYDLW